MGIVFLPFILEEKVMKALFKPVLVAGLIGFGCGAQAANVDGVIWDETVQPFEAQYNFTQWYTSAANSISGAPNLAPNFDAAKPVNTVVAGDVLTGTGEVYNINGTPTSTFIPGGELTVVFGGLAVVNPAAATFDISNAFFNFYADDFSVPGTDYPWPADAASQGDADNAAQGALWLSAKVDSLFLSGNLSGGFVSATLSVTGGDAMSYFTSPFAFDIEYAGSSFFSIASGQTHSNVGNGQFIQHSVPEPASVALVGLGLLGMSLRLRKKA